MKKLIHKLWHSSTQRVMTLGGAGMVLALLADVLIFRRFGGFNTTTDAIVIALTLPRLIGTVGRDATKFSLMTVFIEVRKDKGDAVFADLGARVLNLFFGIGLALTAIGLLFAGPVTSIVGWGLDPKTRRWRRRCFGSRRGSRYSRSARRCSRSCSTATSTSR
ncbi:MAG: hypothetical protein R3C45_05815 [Phycisphaerales bacterium]